MKISVIDGRELGADEIHRWREIQASDDQLASPFLTPQCVAAAAFVRSDIRVAVMEDGNQLVGFFPFQQVESGVGEAVGDRLSDCQAVIALPDFPWTAEELLRASGLTVWHYRRLVISQTPFRRFHTETFRSPLVDLSGGFEAYANARRATGSRALAKVAAAREKLERLVGPLHYQARSTTVGDLHWLLHCKSEQYRRTGYSDKFELAWVVAFLERLQAVCQPEFAGMLSVLWAGDEVAAAHFGMRSISVWNYWFPCFNRKWAAFSPGLILLVEMLRSAASAGIRIVELGAGDAAYKDRFANSVRFLAKGSAVVQEPA